jgi:hypothetical protein
MVILHYIFNVLRELTEPVMDLHLLFTYAAPKYLPFSYYKLTPFMPASW